MFPYVILFSLLSATALEAAVPRDAATDATAPRKARSIWPFTSSDTSAEPVLSKENVLLLEQAGLDKSFNLSSHPLWKIHKYHGIDLKPVHLETEIIKPKAPIGSEPVVAAAQATATASSDSSQLSSATTSELPDLSFLDDLGGLADFLPDPDEEEASKLIAEAIDKEESSHPGFLKRLWWKIWGTPESTGNTGSSAGVFSAFDYLTSIFSSKKKEKEEGGDGEDSLTVYLPETQGAYMAVVLPSDKKANPLAPQQQLLVPSRAAPPLFREAAQALQPLPPNHANQYRDDTGAAAAIPTGIEYKPVAKYPAYTPGGSESQAWIQSWTPHAAYSVHVQGPSNQRQQPQVQPQVESSYGAPPSEASTAWAANEPQEQSSLEPSRNLEAPVETNYHAAELSNSWPAVLTQDVPPVLEPFENSRGDGAEQQASRKSFQGSDVEDKESRETLGQEAPGRSAVSGTKDETDEMKVKDILTDFGIPEGLMKKLQVSQSDIESILKDKESATRALNRLRSLQKEFEMRQDQLDFIAARRAKKQLY